MQLSERDVRTLIERSEELNDYQISVDLESQTVRDSAGFSADFEVDPFRRDNLLRGLDDIGLTLERTDAIAEFESTHA
mgnify:FL=1